LPYTVAELAGTEPRRRYDVNQAKIDTLLLMLLRGGAFLCFAGWMWQHYYWEGPCGVLFWQDGSLDLVEELGGDWESFVGTGANDGWVQRVTAWIAWPCLVCAILTLTVRRSARVQMAGLLAGGGLLAVVAYAKYVSSQRELPMLVEHGGQVLSPVLLVLALAFGVRHRATVVTATLAFVMVFAGHGAYALGLWPTPPNFYGMTTVILGSDHGMTKTLLCVVGALDIAVCVGVLIPGVRRVSAVYAAGWGLATAIARPVAGMSISLSYYGADQYLHEAVLRAPHFLIPMFLFFLWQQPNEHESLAPT